MAGLHTLTPTKKRAQSRRVGRGGKRGKTSGRGHKGQKQHGGHGIRPALRDVIKKLPKRRGHGINRARTVNSGRAHAVPVNLSDLEQHFAKGETVTPKTLVEKGVITARGGKLPLVKILARGSITTAVSVESCMLSAAARAAIEAAGGSVAASQ